MDAQDMKSKLIAVLTEMYENEVFVSLMEFCQGELRVLLWLSEDRDPESNIPSAMADALHVTRGRITAALGSLKTKGFVELAHSRSDRRKVIISLTPSGREYMERRSGQAEAVVAAFVERIGEKRAAELVDILSLTV